jgi:hypothetical protein
MAKKKLDKALNEVLEKPIDEMVATMVPGIPEYDIRDEADARGQYKTKRHPPSGIEYPTSDEKTEPQDKVLVAIQHHLINGDFDKASELIKNFRGAKGGKFFTWHHMNQLMDWVRNIYKYTNMKDLSRNYYQHEMTKDMEIQGVKELEKVKVKEETVDKFIADAEKVLKKKLQMR